MDTQPAASSPRYWAFVSYSHHDSRWGLWLHRALETYRVPGRLVALTSRDGKVPARISPVFIDREELPTAASLSRNIDEALLSSRYLIVVCSPHAAISSWVNEEIKRFKAAGGADRVLCLIVSGEPNASDKPELGELECFPEAVRYNVTESGAIGDQRVEPIAADVRKGRDGAYRAKMKLIAGVLGVSFNDLMRRERRRRIVRHVAAAVATVLILMVIGAVWYRGHQATLAAERRQNSRLAQLMFEKAQIADQKDDGRTAALYGAAWIEYSLLAGELNATAKSAAPDASDMEHKKDFVSSLTTTAVSAKRLAEPDFAGALTASPDGKHLAWARRDGAIVIEDAASGERLEISKPRIGAISTLALTNGLLVAAGSQNGAVILRQAGAGAPRLLRSSGAPVRSVTFAPDGRTLASAGDGSGIELWDVGGTSIARRSVRLLGADQDHYHALAFTPDSRRLGAVADGRGGNTLTLWDVVSGTATGHPRTYADVPESLAFSADGRWMAVGLFDSTIHLSGLGDRAADKVLTGHTRLVGALAFSPDSRLLASGGDDWNASLWDVASRDRIATLVGHARPIVGVAFANGGRSLLTGSSEDHVLQLWNLPHPLDMAATAAHVGPVRAVEWSPAGNVLASAGDDRDIRLWNPSTLQPLDPALPRVHTDSVRALAFTPSGKLLVSAGRDGNIVVWDWQRRKAVHGPVHGHDRWIFGLAISPDGKTLATASWDKSVRLWSLPDLRPLGRLQQDSDAVGGVAFSPDGRLIASASNDHMVRLWDTRAADAAGQRPPLAVLAGHTEVARPVAFAPDGATLVSGGGDGRIKIWDVKTCLAAHACRPQADLMGHYALMIWALAFSPDGSLLASGSQSNDRQTLRLWDARHGKLVAFLSGHRDFVLTARFSPDGRVLASGGNDGDLRLWRVSDFWPLPQRENIYSSHALLNYLAKPPYDAASAHALVCGIEAASGLEIIGTDAIPAVKGGGRC